MQDKHIKNLSLMIAGESGMGLESMGEILMQIIARQGYRLSSEREYPSLIKYGQANVNIHISTDRIRAMSRNFLLGVGLGKAGFLHCMEHIGVGGYIFHNFEKQSEALPDSAAYIYDKGITSLMIPTRSRLQSQRWSLMFENTILLGAVAKAMQMDRVLIETAMKTKFGKKAALLDKNLACLRYGYDLVAEDMQLRLAPATTTSEQIMLIEGNTAIALGAIHAGVRCFFAYPMSPSSSILTYMAATASQTGILVKQVEDEITAAQMTLGASYAGARAMTATSGGGFDLMTETVSLSGMIEVPLVICIAQRPGPATGLPTWTTQGDLLLAIYAGHGEFARIVISVSDPESAFSLTQHAHDLAERFQVPVILLTDKHIAENFQTVPLFIQNTVPVQRYLLDEVSLQKSVGELKRYEITESGVSPRWLPGQSKHTFFCNGDEHHEDGTLNESLSAEQMILKRIRKATAIEQALPDPEIFGNIQAPLTIIGRGSTKNVMMDLLQDHIYDGSWKYIHVEYMWPMRKEFWESIFALTTSSQISPNPSLSRGEQAKSLIATLETNATGQFADLLQQQFGVLLPQRFCKGNGRAFYREEVREWIEGLKSC